MIHSENKIHVNESEVISDSYKKQIIIKSEGNSIITQPALLLIILPHFSEVCLPKGAVIKNIVMCTSTASASQQYAISSKVL
jgi:hypothetical protein